jgi:phosphoribosylformylglycinamidine synthase
MAEACRALDFPVVSGNVSLYNETSGVGIPPTPTVGALGLLADGGRRADFAGLAEGDVLVLVGDTEGELGASLYLRELHGREEGAPPPVDLAVERRNGDFVRGLIRSGQVTVCHDLSDGGLICATAEMALASGVGVTLHLPNRNAHALLFGEDQGRYLLGVKRGVDVLAAAGAAGVPASVVGGAGGEALAVEGLFALPLSRLRESHEGWLPAYMDAPATGVS